MKTLLILSPFLFAATCNDTAKIKVYEHKADDQAKVYRGFYRDNGNDILTYGAGDGYYCVSPSDMEYILNKLKQCLDTREVDNGSILEVLLGQDNNSNK